jgi:hypothetical protein
MDCGCCDDDEIYFESDDQANESVGKLGLQNGAVLIDAQGTEHTGLDTFYGIRRADIVETRNSFQILIDQLNG